MDGILSMKMSSGATDFISGKHVIRWTEVFLLPTKDNDRDEEEPSRAAGFLARAITMALASNLKKLKEADLTPLAVRVILDPENVSPSLPPECERAMMQGNECVSELKWGKSCLLNREF